MCAIIYFINRYRSAVVDAHSTHTQRHTNIYLYLYYVQQSVSQSVTLRHTPTIGNSMRSSAPLRWNLKIHIEVHRSAEVTKTPSRNTENRKEHTTCSLLPLLLHLLSFCVSSLSLARTPCIL